MYAERPTLSSLDPGERAVRELVDRVHVGQDRAIMRHHDGALVLGLHFLADRLGDLRAAVRVQARGRLVGQDQLRVANESASDRRPLLLTARHLARILRVGGLDTQVLHDGADLGLTRGLVLLTLELGDQLELIADTHVGQELVVLEDKTQELQALARPLLLAQLREVLAGDRDAPLVGREQQDIGGQEKLSENVVPPYRAFFRRMTIHDGGLPAPRRLRECTVRRLGECTVSVADSLNTWWNDAT